MSNAHLNTNFLALARELDIMEPKTPEDIYKSHLEKSSHTVDSARANLASSYVNAFVNAGFGTDKLLSAETSGGRETNTNWIYKNKVRSAVFFLHSTSFLYQHYIFYEKINCETKFRFGCPLS